jgi:DNA-binding NtrC family response regulator
MPEHARKGNCPNVVVEALGNGIDRLTYASRPAATIAHSMMSYIGMCEARPLVLLLEDDSAAAEALQLLLRDWGADVVHGLDAEQLFAAAGARTSGASMIITDFHLGADVNGVSLARQLRKIAPGARVLVLSGSVSGEAQRAATDAGYAFMHKPAPPRAIIDWLEQR